MIPNSVALIRPFMCEVFDAKLFSKIPVVSEALLLRDVPDLLDSLLSIGKPVTLVPPVFAWVLFVVWMLAISGLVISGGVVVAGLVISG
jgi:hypothetical protein